MLDAYPGLARDAVIIGVMPGIVAGRSAASRRKSNVARGVAVLDGERVPKRRPNGPGGRDAIRGQCRADGNEQRNPEPTPRPQ